MSGTHLRAYPGPYLLGLHGELRFELALWCELATRALSRKEFAWYPNEFSVALVTNSNAGK